jgi:UDP-glucose 4-epimerase
MLIYLAYIKKHYRYSLIKAIKYECQSDAMKGKTMLVTGGAGFIGSHICEELHEDNTVIIVDNLSSGRLENVAPFLGDNVTLVTASIAERERIAPYFEGVDYVFHEAAIASVPQSVADPVSTNEVNVAGTLNVLLLARDAGVRKVVFASSSAVYGDTRQLPIDEERILRPLSPYAASKIMGEYYLTLFSELYGLPTASLRYFNVYGPRQDPSSDYAAVIPKFIQSALAGTPPAIFGDGGQTRDFIYVKDVVAANVRAAESKATGAFNIAGGEKTSVSELAELIGACTGSRAAPVHGPERVGDIRHSYASTDKARDTLGFLPRTLLSEGLEETIAWYRALAQ